MPPPGRRRPRPNLVNASAVSRGSQPAWFLRKREEGWNSRFASDGPSYFDVPGAMALGDGASRTRPDMTKVTGAGGGSSVGVGFSSSDKPAGKRMRIRRDMTPSLSRGGTDAPGARVSRRDLYLMEKMYPENPNLAITAGSAAASVAAGARGAQRHQGSIGYPTPGDVRDDTRSPPPQYGNSATGFHGQDHSNQGEVVQGGGKASLERNATKLLAKLHALVEDWPTRSHAHSERRGQQQQQQQGRSKGHKKGRTKSKAKEKKASTGGIGEAMHARSSADVAAGCDRSCVEKIVAWSLVVSPESCRPKPFRWSSEDYLAKMHHDLDFVSDALAKDAPAFGKGNPLLLTRSEAAGQPRAGQVGRYYAATYVILDAVNRARDAATAAQAGDPPGERAQEAGVHVSRRGKGYAGGGADGVGGGGLGVVVIASDDESLSKAGGLVGGEGVERRKRKKQKPRTQRVPKEQTMQQQEQAQEVGKQQQRLEQLERDQAGKRADPHTGGLLEGGDGLLDLGEEVGEETLSPKNTLDDEEDLSDAYGESFEEYEEYGQDDTTSPEIGTPQLQEDHDSSEAQQFQGKGGQLSGSHEHLLATQLDKEAEEARELREAEQLKAREADEAHERRLRQEEEEEEEKEKESRRLREAEEQQVREKEAEEAHLKEEESRRNREEEQHRERKANEAHEQRLRKEKEEEEDRLRMQEAERQRVLEEAAEEVRREEEEGRRLREAEAEEARLKDEESHRLREIDQQRERQQAEAYEQRLQEEEAQRLFEAEQLRNEEEGVSGADEPQYHANSDVGPGEQEQEDVGMPTRIGDYDVDSLLGDGAYGWVYKCYRRRRSICSTTGGSVRRNTETDGDDDDITAVVAIKQFKGLTDMEDEHTRNYVRLTQEREADLALSLIHPNIVRCLGTINAGGTCVASGDGGVGREEVAFLIFEHVPGTLLDLIQEHPGGLSLLETTNLLGQLLSAVDFLHQHGVVHRDVKPENILVDKKKTKGGVPTLKLCDLGTARKASEIGQEFNSRDTIARSADDTTRDTPRTWTEYVGSRWYRAPEMLAGSTHYGAEVDVWACACLAAEMSSGRPLFPGEDEGELAASMAALLGPLPLDLASRLREMGYTPPPPRGRPTRSIEACLDGSTGTHEARRSNPRGSRVGGSGFDADTLGIASAEVGESEEQRQHYRGVLEILGGMLVFDPASRLSAQECLLRASVFGSGSADADASFAGRKPSAGDLGDFETRRASTTRSSRGCSSSATKTYGSGATAGAVVGGDDGSSLTNDSKDDDEHQEDQTISATSEAVSAGNDGREPADIVAGPFKAGEGFTVGSKSPSQFEAPVPPPQETTFLGEEGYVQKRVAEIEEKVEYYNPGNKTNAAKGQAPTETMEEDSVRTIATTEAAGEATLDRSDASSVNGEGGGGPTEQGQRSAEGAPAAGTSPPSSGETRTISDPSTALDSRIAESATVEGETTAQAAEGVVDTTRADEVGDEDGETKRWGGREGGQKKGNTSDNSDDGYFLADDGLEKSAEGDNKGNEQKGVMSFGDEDYGSDSFDEGEQHEEDQEGALTTRGGRTSFFPNPPELSAAVDAVLEAEPSEITQSINDNTAAASLDETEEASLQHAAPRAVDIEDTADATASNSKPDADKDDEGKTEEVTKGMEEDEAENGDGWRVTGAFRVLSASGPWGEMAVNAVKGLLRQPRDQQHQQQQRQGGSTTPVAGVGYEDNGKVTALFQKALEARGETGGHVRRSMERAFASASTSEEPNTATETGDKAAVPAPNGVGKALEAFAAAAVAAEGEGLAVSRLARLTAGLARCVDGELQEAAQTCQAWAAHARQGKRPAHTGDPLLECAEHLNSSCPIRQTKISTVGGDGGGDSGVRGAVDGVGGVCADFLAALCEAADRGRSSATADIVHASSTLETLSRVVCSLAPFILDADRPKVERDENLISVATSLGLDEGLARKTLRPPSLASSYFLSPAGQAVLLKAALTQRGERRINLVTTREEALEQIQGALERDLPPPDRDGRGDVGGSNTITSGVAPLAEALILNPYYLSSWGNKKVLGQCVEEGEGLGPRKELFELASRQLSERWRSPQTGLFSSPMKATARGRTAEVDLVISFSASDAPERAFYSRVKAGWRIKVGSQTRILGSVKVEEGIGGDDSSRYSARVTKLWVDGFQSEEAHLQEASCPVLVYQEGSESKWLDAKADRSNDEHRKRLRTLGALLALSVTNSCRLPVELPDLFFRWLLLGGESAVVKQKHGQQLSPSCPSFEPSVEDMVALDKSLERPFEALKDAVQSDDALKGLLEIEDLPADTSAADYIAHMGSRGELQQKDKWRHDGKDFDFRVAFSVYEDRELVTCVPLHEAFWSVVQIELSPEERRRLLLFITGTDRLPEAGCETLSIEIPFEVPGGSKDIETARLAATKSLGQVPTAHTCDNILELPNYWMLLMRHEGRDEKTQLSDVSVGDVSLVVLDEGLNTPTWSQPHGVYVGGIRRPNGIEE
ncbi:possible MAPK [Ectocarpus siliculosus]|uniref:Possible MAPK n=1 Tax=Ectocarpus siliculosus TaxID=2880 RepID=D7G395_ECTSI|nr:possible MAPK [Ectocarpus siliculosus]|eukprot:CBJ26942.1 possible MAPK [Ectocarpus siliculosus]